MKKALIVHVGNNYTRAIKSIEKVKPDLVYFIFTKSHEMYMETMIKEAPVTFDKRSRLIEDFQSIRESYEKSKEIFKELEQEDYEIHVGISNGTKAMVVGLSLASVGYDCEFSYVGSDKGGREENGDVKPGKEKVFDEFHPMKQLATIEINRAKRYFNNYQFAESLYYFKKARESGYNTERMGMYIKIVKLYQLWDKFENTTKYIKNESSKNTLDDYLKTRIKQGIHNDEDLKNYFYSDEKEFMNQIDRNIEFLEKKISSKGKIIDDNLYYYLPDLLNNAQRRIEEEKFDDATARLYRVTELISQIRLYEHNLIDKKRLEDNKVFHIPKQDLVDKSNLKSSQFVATKEDFQNYKKETLKLSLKENFELLWCFEDKLAIKFLKDKNLDSLVSSRNNSILAHGLIPANCEDTKELYDKLIVYSRKTFENLDKCMEYAKFPKFRDIYD